MQEFLQLLVSGIATGAIFASLALALVLIYNAMGLVNFAQGEMAMFATFIAYTLVNRGMSFWIAFPVTMVLAFGGGILLGALTNGGGASSREEYRGEGLTSDDEARYSEPSVFSASTAKLRRQFGDTWDHIADALIGVAAAKAIEYVSELVPGFREQFAERHPEHRTTFSSASRSV